MMIASFDLWKATMITNLVQIRDDHTKVNIDKQCVDIVLHVCLVIIMCNQENK